MKKSKLISLLLCLVLVFAMSSVAFADEEAVLLTTTAAPANDILIATAPSNDITIIHTNDVHCGYLAYDKVATLAKDADLLVDAGDAVQGEIIGTLSKGEYVIDIMNYLGYDVAGLGNHEFDYSTERLLELTKLADFPYVCCNFVDTKTGEPIFDPYKVVEVKGKKLAFIGVDTPETFVKSTPTYFQDKDGNWIYGFCEGNNGKALYQQIQKYVDKAKKEADYVIVLGHLGIDAESHPWTSEDVIKNTTGIDILIDGHSHSTFAKTVKNKAGKAVTVAQTGTKLENVGKIVIKADGTITAETVALADVVADADTTAYLETVTDKFADLKNKVVAKTTVKLTTLNEDGTRAIRSKETNLGDLCADAYRTLLDADVAFVNGGGIRADIEVGDVTYENIIKVHPYGNSACLVEVTGQQILDALELGASANPGEFGGFLQVSGLTYKINTAIPSSVVVNDKSEFVKVSGQRRVSDVKVGGVAIDPKKTYKLASHNYMLKSAGDGFNMFGEKNVKLIQDEVLIDNQVLINYIVDELNGVVGSQYAEPQGRIEIVYDESAVETETVYKVVKGDCLWSIAYKTYGDGSLWKKIYAANKGTIKNPNMIFVGQEIVIPAA